MNLNLFLIGGAAVVLVLIVVVALARRGRRGVRVDVQQLEPADALRYTTEMDEAEAMFVKDPSQAAARARGVVEEVLRRQGFPDRVDAEQRVADLRRHDRQAAEALKGAADALRGARQEDTERMRRAVREYRAVLDRLLPAETE